MKRRRAREQAFLLLFANSFRDEGMDKVASLAARSAGIKVNEFALSEARGAYEHSQELDEIITTCLKGWTLGRISKVSLAVLRLALYEMKYAQDIPVSISINEAVELAKKFSDKKESAFVNGVLGTAAKLIQMPENKATDSDQSEDTATVPGEEDAVLISVEDEQEAASDEAVSE